MTKTDQSKPQTTDEIFLNPQESSTLFVPTLDQIAEWCGAKKKEEVSEEGQKA